MGYFKLRRSQLILASFIAFALLFALVPSIDISISRFFFRGHSFPYGPWQKFLHEGMGVFLCGSMAIVIALFVYNRFSGRHVCNIDARRVVYLFLVLIIGAGLIVNVMLKDNFGRARPRDIAEFGGT